MPHPVQVYLKRIVINLYAGLGLANKSPGIDVPFWATELLKISKTNMIILYYKIAQKTVYLVLF